MKPNKKKFNSWIITAPVGAGAIAYLFCVFLPHMKAIASVRALVDERHRYVAAAETLRPVVDELRKQLEPVRTYNALRRSRLCREQDLTQVFSRISLLAKATGVTMTRFEPQPAQPLQSLAKTPVLLALSGSFDSVNKMLAELEHLPRDVEMEDLKLEASRENAQLMKCEAVLGVFVDKSQPLD